MFDLRIEVVSDEINTRSFTSREGKPLAFREQSVFFHLGDKYPRPGILSLGDAPALAPGMYTLGPGSFDVNRYNQLTLSRRLNLVSVK